MRAPAKLAAFAAVLALLFGGGLLAGDVLGPATQAGAEDRPSPGHGEMPSGDRAQPVRGLAVAANGLRLVVEDPELRRGRSERLALRIVDEQGRAVRDFDVEHEKRMHLILARRDLTAFQHLHPRQRADGTWTTTARVRDAGSFRLFADFTRRGRPHTLAADVRVDGPAELRPLPAPHRSPRSDHGDEVRLETGRVRPGEQAELRFRVLRDGEPVATQPYLGAGGHLVALREGDLAFLHVHPSEHATGGAIAFEATFPTPGRYRLFLQFRREGRVHTVAFTQEVR